MEEVLLGAEGIRLESFNIAGGLTMDGNADRSGCRSASLHRKWMENGLLLTFALPRGSYATSVLREIMKDEL